MSFCNPFPDCLTFFPDCFIFFDDCTDKTKEHFENKNPINTPSDKPSSILSENDQKKLDSLFNDQKKNLDKTTMDLERSVKYLAEDNGKKH